MCRQACWALLPADFNFIFIHKPGKTMLHFDLLSWLSTHEVTDADNNLDQTVLKHNHFRQIAATAFATTLPLKKKIRECAKHEFEVADTLATLRKKGPRCLVSGLLEWEEDNGLLYYKGKLYIPNDKELRADVIRTCHDTPIAGHPGKHNTLELVSCHYWWP